MTQQQHILLVEDEESIADSILYVFNSEGFNTHWVNEGQKALDWLNQLHKPVDFIVLDVGLPDMTGFEVCKSIRKISQTPILFLTARSDEIDRVVGLEIGADDYMVKPFSPRELSARVRAILRRMNHVKDDEEKVNSIQRKSPLYFDTQKKSVYYFEIELLLTHVEYHILLVLNQHPGWKYSREQLMSKLWDEPEMANPRVIDAHIKSIRSKLNAVNPKIEVIITHRGFGYSLKENW